MSLVTAPTSSSPSSSIQPTLSSTLSPGFYRRQHHYRQQQQQQQQHFSTLVNVGLGQPQPLSSTLLSSLPQQLLNCTLRNLENTMMNHTQIPKDVPNNQMEDHSTPPAIINESSTPSSVGTDETPPIDRWSRDFRSLIEDRDGFNLFKQYMEEVGLSHMLDFYFACQGLKKSNEELQTKNRLISVIFKRFILNPKVLSLSEQCRQNLLDVYKNQRKNPESSSTSSDSATQASLEENTFDEAFEEIEEQLSGAIYENFLKSKIFLDHINSLEVPTNNNDNNEQETLCNNSDSDQAKNHQEEPDDLEEQDVGFEYGTGNKFTMPTIDETSEDGDSTVIEVSKFAQQIRPPQPPPRLFPPNKLSMPSTRERPTTYKEFYNFDLEKINCMTGLDEPPNPYHVNKHAQYSTVQYNSKKDSEIESISSSDSSFVCSRNDKKSSLRNAARTTTMNLSALVPRFQRPPPQQVKNQLLPTENPDEFARKLIEKLNKVRSEQETNIKLRLALNACERERAHSPGLGSSHGGQQREAGVGQYSSSNNNNNQTTSSKSSGQTKSGLGQALKKIDFSAIESESGQAILDKHFAQVFETPNADSPTVSTSNQSSSAYHSNHQQIHYVGTTTTTATTAATMDGGGGSSSLIMHSLPPPSPLSPTSHFVSHFGGAVSSSNNVAIPVYVRFSTEEVPHKLTMIGPHVTLLAFKQQIPCKRGIQQFYFKRQCTESEKQEIDAAYVLEQINDDQALLPQCDGKIYALIEMSN